MENDKINILLKCQVPTVILFSTKKLHTKKQIFSNIDFTQEIPFIPKLLRKVLGIFNFALSKVPNRSNFFIRNHPQRKNAHNFVKALHLFLCSQS